MTIGNTTAATGTNARPTKALAALLLRVGVAYVFVRFGIDKIIGWQGAVVVLVGAVAAMGTTGIGVRDAGLLCGALAVAAQGAGPWSIDALPDCGHTAPMQEKTCPSR